ncbi:hypothetical protein [Phenylobacterium montanum]|uniref:Uncharacterized protein n=1 Tax=Phenylobacterium montanum TaxID=2823693 RepID=A0A975FZF3_9CAUL|nr:hypothetical protein [Caulobacter sp. S6]QUD87672.1 hypothetical protein KCG34_21920 [Caulobacter sp. S6]
MPPFRLIPAVLALALLASPALAEEPQASDAPVATAKGAPAAPPDTTAADIQQFVADGADDQKEPLPDHKPHGFVSVGVGTGGYREVAGAVTVPIGDKDQGQVTLAIDAGKVDGRRH